MAEKNPSTPPAVASIPDPTGLGPLFEALSKAQAKVKGSEKDGTNPHFKSKYSSLASVWEACREALTSEGLAVAQTFDMDGGVAVMVTVLGHKSGAMLTGRYPLNPVKSDPQGMAAAATYARRVGLAAMVGVAPEDDDGETAAGRGATPQAKQTAAPPAVPAIVEPRPAVLATAPAEPLTDLDILSLSDKAKLAGFRTRADMSPLLEEIAGVTSLRAMERRWLPDLIAALDAMAVSQ